MPNDPITLDIVKQERNDTRRQMNHDLLNILFWQTFYCSQFFASHGPKLKDNQLLACCQMYQLQTLLVHKHQGASVFFQC